MPSPLHETLRELFTERPDQLAPLLREVLRLPQGRLVAMPAELTDPRMTQLLPDVVLAYPNAERPEVIIIIEVQLAIAELKRRVGPHYCMAGYSHWGCRVEVVVITPYAHVERWAGVPIRVGEGNVVTPYVLGPSRIPLLDLDAIAQAPVLGMLATLAHLDDARSAEHAVWTLEALAKWSGDAEGRLADILQAAMPVALLRRVEELMATGRYEYQSDFAKKYYAEGLLAGEAKGQERGREEGREAGREEGRIAGQARALCLLLQARGFEVSEALERRILGACDATGLDTWTRRAATATSLDDIFSSVPSSQDD